MFSSNTTQVSSGGYQISRSLRFNRSDSAYLNRTPTSTGSQTTYTLSLWVKLGNLTTGTDSFMWGSGDASVGDAPSLTWKTFDGSYTFVFAAAGTTNVITSSVYRDPSAWYHIVVGVDTTQATSSNRVKMYVNGVQVTFSTATYPAQNSTYNINTSSYPAYIGCIAVGASRIRFWEGYQTEFNFIDGQALTPSSFGETNAQTGVWQPKAYSGSYGTNGFYLNFSDNSNTTAATLGKDYSGNGNNWTPNNFSVTAGAGNDSLVDSPTSYGTDTGVGGTVRGNYATWNAILQTLGGTASTYTNGNLVASSSNSNWVLGTIRINDAKYYFELVPDSAASGLYLGINSTTDVRIAAYSGGIEASPAGGSNQGSLASWSNGDVIGVAVDGPNKTVQFYRNGSTYGTLVTYTTALDLWAFARNGGAGSSQVTANFGQRPFAYTAPSGFKALCTQNLPTPTIGATAATQAGKYFNTIIWTGDSANPRTFTGVGFQPDLVWAKGRSIATSHFLSDAVRGVTSSDTRTLATNNTTAETNQYSPNGGVTAFTSDGFTTSGSTNLNLNFSGQTFVAWNWKANGSGVTNTSGSITSTVSANTTSGFSVVTYAGNSTLGATVGHGLGVAPSMIIVKSRSAATNWLVYHAAIGNTKALFLNLTNATDTDNYWNNTSPTSTVFSLNASTGLNSSGSNYVAYCFAEVAGYSKFGSFVGNGSADGPFCFTGFKPAFVLVKSSTFAGSSWRLWDAKRNTYNVVNSALFPNLSNAEVSTADYAIDFLSNGFKIRAADSGENNNGDTFIYAAFAETPLKFSLAR